MRISAVIIARDEADRIGPCLESVRFCDEVLVLDSGSRDGTPDLCRRAGARVIETDWPGWVIQKNRAADAAAHDWILSVDADERVDPALREAIEAIRRGRGDDDPGPAAYAVRRKVLYLGRWLRHGGWYPEWRARLFDRRRARWGGTDPHDRIVADGPVARVRSGDLEHRTYRSLADHVEQINRFTSVAAAHIVARGRRPSMLALLVRPPFHFLTTYVLRLGFLDRWPGLVMAGMRAWYVLLKYAKARELAAGRDGEAA